MTPRYIWRQSWQVARVAVRNGQPPRTVCDHPDIRSTVPRAVRALRLRVDIEPYYIARVAGRQRALTIEVAAARVRATPQYQALMSESLRAVFSDPHNPYAAHRAAVPDNDEPSGRMGGPQ